LRLNATYRGPGTQWPPLELAARALRAQRRYRGALNELPRFAVGLFKGEGRAGSAAILHRSPPIAGSGITRLFLCLNEDMNEDWKRRLKAPLSPIKPQRIDPGRLKQRHRRPEIAGNPGRPQ